MLDAIERLLIMFIRHNYYSVFDELNEEVEFFKKEDKNFNTKKEIKIAADFGLESHTLSVECMMDGFKFDWHTDTSSPHQPFYVIAYYKNRGLTQLIPTPNNQYEVYNDAFNINLTDIHTTRNRFQDWFLDLENSELQTIFDRKDFNYRLRELEIFRKMIKIFYNNLSESSFDELKGNRSSRQGEKIFDISNKWLELRKNGEFLKIEQLSKGEQSLLMLVADIIKRQIINQELGIRNEDGNGIVLIDEIDQHLHRRKPNRTRYKLDFADCNE